MISTKRLVPSSNHPSLTFSRPRQSMSPHLGSSMEFDIASVTSPVWNPFVHSKPTQQCLQSPEKVLGSQMEQCLRRQRPHHRQRAHPGPTVAGPDDRAGAAEPHGHVAGQNEGPRGSKYVEQLTQLVYFRMYHDVPSARWS